MWIRKLTVYEPDSCHGDREESLRRHGHLNQTGGEDKEKQDGGHTDGYAHPLRDPAKTHAVCVTHTFGAG